MIKNKEWELMNKRWFKLSLALILMLIAYGFASLAIDSGSLLEYALSIFFLVWGIKTLFKALAHKKAA